MSDASTFLQSIITVSEKAANIARAIRYESHLLSLLIREKKDDEKNPRFQQDFKTLADVLVQEVVKHDLGKQYPRLVNHIYGEESNEFTSLDGEILDLHVGENEDETTQQLLMILGDENAARLLAKHVHSSVDMNNINVTKLPEDLNQKLPINELGIWIDPIDSTAEYISGDCNTSDDLCTSGLPCVTVLIGAFHRPTGLPVAGVINQPFHLQVEDKWCGRCFWGLSWEDKSVSSVSFGEDSIKKLVALSSSEDSEVKLRLQSGGFNLVKAAGAGYKLLCVVLGLVDAYVLSKGSTYSWDTCGPAAILKSQRGAVVDYTLAVSSGSILEIKYKEGMGVEECCNKGGVIAFRDKTVLDLLVRLLK